MKRVKNIFKQGWQTVMFFTLFCGAVIFIWNALTLPNYLIKTDILILPSNLNSITQYNPGKTTTFLFDVKDDIFWNNLPNNIKRKELKLKKIKQTDIIKIKLKAQSKVDGKKKINNVINSLIKYIDEYNIERQKVIAINLTDVVVVNTYTILYQRTLWGLIGGFILGVLLLVCTNFRVDFFLRKGVGYSGKESIVGQKIKEELQRKKKGEFKIIEDQYAFNLELQNKTEYLQEKIAEKTSKEKKKSIELPTKIIPQVIAMNRVVSGKKTQKTAPAPENLPVFTEDSYNKELISEKNSVDIDKKIKEKNKEDKTKPVKQSKVKKAGRSNEENSKEKQPGRKLTKAEFKKPSAHNIANGFAVDHQAKLQSDNESVKERLNKLLRGEL